MTMLALLHGIHWGALMLGALVAMLWWIWRKTAYYCYALRMRFRFYRLRNKCVMLVAKEIMPESDPLFQFFYDLANKCAGDTRRLDTKAFIDDVTRAVLLDFEEGDQEITSFIRSVKQRPREFAELVEEFYSTIHISLLDSSTTLQMAELSQLIPRLKPLKNKILAIYRNGYYIPLLKLQTGAQKRKVSAAYTRAQRLQLCFAAL